MKLVNERIKYLRKDILSLTQEKFAEKIGLKRNTIAMYESGDKIPSDRTIKDICREFEIDEDWLRTGEGEMKIKRTRNQEIQALANSVMLDVDESFKKRFFVALSKLKESDWEVLEKLIDEISNKGGE